MDFAKQIEFYKVIKSGFNAPLASNPLSMSTELKKGDILVVIGSEPSECAYTRLYDEKHNCNYTKLSLRKDFLELNKKIFKKVSI